MLKEFEQHLTTKFPFLKEKKTLIAISGGVDSVVLTCLLKKLNYPIALAHCNFQLRNKESDEDELFVNELAKELGLEIFNIKFDTKLHSKKNKQSTQVAARHLRYNWFKTIVSTNNFDFLATAHHADDNIETFLINFTRGTGLEGLTGIPEINNYIIRPLLPFSRKEIIQFAKTQNISWREDSSNTHIEYLRNKIRHKVIPILKEINPGLAKTFNNTATFLKQSQQIIDEGVSLKHSKVVSYDKNITKLSIKELNNLNNPNAYLYYFLKSYGFTEWNDVYNLINAQSGKMILTKSHILLKDRDFLLLLPSDKKTTTDKQHFTITCNTKKISEPINLSFKNVQKKVSLDKNTIYVDKNLLNYPLTLRKWNDGDFFFPKGMKGKKKVSKFFKDEKISLIEKQNIWLLCSDKNEIIWILGKRQDRRFLPSDKTTNIVQVKYISTPVNN
ncbi:tRNA(Ile)-lysidine synthase [Tenacibaculum sp. 190524A02b]|uniref:tRNA(Ile)-lysidine synthase n=1 Tax=Tenacibaculum vairaonense TaxID=3137860 RepID=A0ABM9PMD3_9FLAO